MKLALKDGILYESVLVAEVKDKYYAAPVGFVKYGDLVKIKVYRNTTLYDIVSMLPRITLNVTFDPFVYAYLAFKKEFGVDESRIKEFVVLENGVPRLRGCVGYVVARGLRVEHFNEFSNFDFRVEDVKVCEEAVVEPFSRCYAQLIEALIHASRVKFVEDRALLEKSSRAFDFIYEATRKTCSSEYSELVVRLRGLVEEWLRRL